MEGASAITSDEVNFLVFRYLQESGFTHAAFTLGYEACLNKNTINGNDVPPGALISFIQKGVQYLEMETSVDQLGQDVESDFGLLSANDLLTKDVAALRRTLKEKREKRDREAEREREREQERERERLEKEREERRELDRQEKERQRERERQAAMDAKEEEKAKMRIDAAAWTDGGPQPMEEDVEPFSLNVPPSNATVFEGHMSEVFTCAWNPNGQLLASGSGDSTARIWTVPEGPCGPPSIAGGPKVKVLRHVKGKNNEKSKDVTTLDWNGDGTFLATGSYDGQARVWTKEGELRTTLIKHKGPIFSLKWSKKSDLLVSGSVDKSAIVWDAKTGEMKQQFEFHQAPTLDVDWRTNSSFASCSTDSMIYVCKLGEEAPQKIFAGHVDEVNCIKWNPSGQLLASCSDDHTAKIWSMKSDKCVYDLKEHQRVSARANVAVLHASINLPLSPQSGELKDKLWTLIPYRDHEVYTIKWSPCGANSMNPNMPPILASASFDATIKLWDADNGQCIMSLGQHTEPVYAVAFSPDGKLVASGSFDKTLKIWSVHDGRLLRSYRGGGGIFEVCWNKDGDKVAACFSNKVVCVIDYMQIPSGNMPRSHN